MNEDVRWLAGYVGLWIGLTALGDIPQTADLAAALALTTALATTYWAVSEGAFSGLPIIGEGL